MENTKELSCPVCGVAIAPTANFCSQCGAELKEPPFSISIAKQILVYFVSFFLAPFGLGFAFKYLKLHDKKAKTIGIIAILLTILGIATVLMVSTTFTRSLYAPLNTLNF